MITLGEILHFAYCKHSWGRMHFDNEWEINASVALGDVFHEKVHDPFNDECRGAKKTVRSMPVFNDAHDLYGVADCVEFIENPKGAYIAEMKKNCDICVVEYKSGKPGGEGIRDSDKLQLAAQMLCVEEMFGVVPTGFVYYGKIKRRVRIGDYEKAKSELFVIIAQINYYRARSEMPKPEEKLICNGCSFSDKCLPKLKQQSLNVRQTIISTEKNKN